VYDETRPGGEPEFFRAWRFSPVRPEYGFGAAMRA